MEPEIFCQHCDEHIKPCKYQERKECSGWIHIRVFGPEHCCYDGRNVAEPAANIESRLDSRVSPSPRARRAMYEWINKMGR